MMQAVHTIVSWFEDKSEEHQILEHLQKHGFRCISCANREEFIRYTGASHAAVNIVILDLNLRESDAILTCNELKSQTNYPIPFVIIISDRIEEYTQVTALDQGADDYQIKPLKPQLFLKRIEALITRGNIHKVKNNTFEDSFFIDAEKHLVMIGNNKYELPRKEFELLNLFYTTPSKIFSRQEIALLLWKKEQVAKQRTIDVHIRNIRKSLGKNIIRTVKGLGYGLNRKLIN